MSKAMAASLLASILFLGAVILPAATPEARTTQHAVAAERDPLEAPLQGLRSMLKAMDALIAAFQEDSEIFTKLVEVYQAGGPLWARLEECIEETHRELREGPSI